MSIVVDVSQHNGADGAPIPKLLKYADAIWMRASIGTQKDVALDVNAAAAVESGKPYGFYCFGWPTLDPRDQAAAFWRYVEPYMQPTTGLCYDAERGRSAKQAGKFAGELRKLIHQDRQLTLYTGAWYWRDLAGNPDATQDFDALWLARYTQHHQPLDTNVETASVDFHAHGLAGFRRAAMVQFGSVDFGANHFDGNLFDGDIAKSWQKVFGDGGTPPPVRPPIDQRPRYRLGGNALLDATIANLKVMQMPDPGNGPAWEAGVEDLRQDALDALAALHIADPLD